MLGSGGHDRHSPPSKEIEAIGGVVRMPQVLALRIPPDAPQRPIARQMIQRDAGQRLAVAMMREQLCAPRAAILEASSPRGSGAVRGFPFFALAAVTASIYTEGG